MRTGRPKAENKRSRSITIRLTEEEQKKLSAYATKHSTTMTEVVRRCLDDILSK